MLMPDIEKDPDAEQVIKRAIPIVVKFAKTLGVIKSIEGEIHYKSGDALMVGTKGEPWVIQRYKFDQSYSSEKNIHHGDDGSYIKKPVIVWAKQLTEETSVLVGWQAEPLLGKPGNWLLQYGNNDFGIVQNDIFNQTYEKLG